MVHWNRWFICITFVMNIIWLSLLKGTCNIWKQWFVSLLKATVWPEANEGIWINWWWNIPFVNLQQFMDLRRWRMVSEDEGYPSFIATIKYKTTIWQSNLQTLFYTGHWMLLSFVRPQSDPCLAGKVNATVYKTEPIITGLRNGKSS